jgi:hypothetical protein
MCYSSWTDTNLLLVTEVCVQSSLVFTKCPFSVLGSHSSCVQWLCLHRWLFLGQCLRLTSFWWPWQCWMLVRDVLCWSSPDVFLMARYRLWGGRLQRSNDIFITPVTMTYHCSWWCGWGRVSWGLSLPFPYQNLRRSHYALVLDKHLHFFLRVRQTLAFLPRFSFL